jgi:hypothetical protein
MSDVTPEFLAAVSEHTGVPVNFLTGDTTAAVWDSAQTAVDWKASTAPEPQRPPTAAVSVSSPPACVPTPQSLVAGSDDWLTAWRAGRLGPAGLPQPPPRRTGEAHRNAGPQ